MPYSAEHSTQLNPPDKYIQIRRENDKFSKGIHALWGITKDQKTELQAIRFNVFQFTETQAKDWLKEHDYKITGFEAAIEKSSAIALSALGYDFNTESDNQLTINKSISILKSDNDKQNVYGVVLEPNTVDLQDDIVSELEIEIAAHDYIQKSRHIGLQHKDKADADLIESYIAPVDFELNNQKVTKGSWIIGVHVNSDKLWKEIKKTGINGFSIGGYGTRSQV